MSRERTEENGCFVYMVGRMRLAYQTARARMLAKWRISMVHACLSIVEKGTCSYLSPRALPSSRLHTSAHPEHLGADWAHANR